MTTNTLQTSIGALVLDASEAERWVAHGDTAVSDRAVGAIYEAVATLRAVGSRTGSVTVEDVKYDLARVDGLAAVWHVYLAAAPDAIAVGHRVHITAGVYSGFTGTVVAITDGGERAHVRAEHVEGGGEPVTCPVRWLRRDDLLDLPNPVDMRTPALVREYTASRVADAISGRDRGPDAHHRHIAVVNALRTRGVLD